MFSNADLAAGYLNLIQDIGLEYLDRSHPNSKCGENKLSGMFLPSIPEGYTEAKNKIMIIGREPRRWDVVKLNERVKDVESYIHRAIETHQNHSRKELGVLPAPAFGDTIQRANVARQRGESYFNFVRRVGQKSGFKGIIHANLFCFSWAKNNPDRCPEADIIKYYSERLLKFQISYFNPDIIIFAHGKSGLNFRRKIFPIEGEDNVCLPAKSDLVHPLPIEYFWEFHLLGKYKSYRINHPSATPVEHRRAREYLLKLLPEQ